MVLMMSIANEPLFLQVKEADASVLEPYAGKSAYAHHGERVVDGPAADAAGIRHVSRLGHRAERAGISTCASCATRRSSRWSRPSTPRCCRSTAGCAAGCWRGRMRRRASPGRSAAISATADQFDEAMGNFALAYADQAERDHAALKAAVRNGIVDVQLER